MKQDEDFLKEELTVSERIRGIESALLKCIGGDLRTRIPLSERFDEIDGIATGINILLDEVGLMLVERAQHEADLEVAKGALERDLNTAIVDLTAARSVYSGRTAAALTTIARAATEHLAVGRAEIWLLDKAGSALVRRAAFAAAGQTIPEVDKLTVSDYAAYCDLLEATRIIHCAHPHDEPALAPYLGSPLIPTDVGALMDCPVRRRGEVTGVLRVQTLNGERAWRAAELTFVSSLADLVTQHLEIAELVERERELAEAQEIAHLGSWSWDLGTQVYWSDETYRIFGHAVGAFSPTLDSYTAQVVETDRAMVQAKLADCMERGIEFAIIHGVRRHSGEIRVVNCSAALVRDPDGRPIRLRGTCLDITELAHAKKAAAAGESAEEANVALRRSRSALRETLNSLAHDIRTPLASLKLALGRLLHPQADFQEVVSALRSEVEYLDGLIANLVSLVQIEGGTVQFSYRPSNLSLLIERVQLRFQWLAADEGAVVEVALPDGPLVVSLDPLAMEQAVGNLVHNAIKYAQKHVALLLYVEADQVVIAVHDDRPSLPQPQDSADPTSHGNDASGGRTGLSLGLNITGELVRRHGGLFSIGPHPQSGTRAEIRLPSTGR